MKSFASILTILALSASLIAGRALPSDNSLAERDAMALGDGGFVERNVVTIEEPAVPKAKAAKGAGMCSIYHCYASIRHIHSVVFIHSSSLHTS
jgi:hypothetical protein